MKTISDISMTMPEPELLLAYAPWLAAAGGLLVLAFILMWARKVRSQRRTRLEHDAAFRAMQADLSALCATTAGFGERMSRLEQQLRSLSERVDMQELREPNERSFAQAIRLVHKGADSQELVSTFGLSRGEAELLVSLHGMAKAG